MADIVRIKKPPQKTTRVARGFVRAFISFEKQVFVFTLGFGLMLLNAHGFIAFEAHVVNIKAEVAQIDPPLVAPAGGNYVDPVDITIDDADADATHIFYTMMPGTDASLAPDPVCGDPLGGTKPVGPLTISFDTVVKAIACDSAYAGAHASSVTTEIYDFPQLRGAITGHKYFDADRSGTLTAGDFPVAGWQIQAATSTFATSTVTDATGAFTFAGLLPDTYTIEEESRDGWEHVTPKTAEIVIDSDETEVIDFFNFDTGFACLPKDIVFPSGLAVQAAGLLSENNDDIALASNVIINGDARSNDDIERTTGASNININGSATSTDQVDDGINVSKMVLEGAPAASLPDAMISEWQARAADGGTVNGSFAFPNGTVGLVLGPTEIMGNLTFGNSNGAAIKGPIYVHGNLSIGQNTTITQDAAFGDQFVAIVVDGVIDISSNVSFNGSGARGTFLLISTHDGIAGDDAAIETNPNNSDLGDVVLYASAGDIHVRSNRTLLAAFASHSPDIDSSADAAVRLDSNVTVNYRELPDKISCGPRQPYETTSRILINEFMPNTAGDDQGTAGAPLDGEWVELFNPTASSVDITGWFLYDSVNTHDLPITLANVNEGSLVIPSDGYLVVYREGDGNFELNNAGGDTVRLWSGLIGGGGVLVDSHTYSVSAGENKSFARIPDGAANWVDPDATPGAPNIMDFFVPLSDPAFEPADLPALDITPPEFTPIEPLPLSEEAPQIVTEDQQAKIEEPAVAELPSVSDASGDGDSGDSDGDGGDATLAESPTPGVGQAEQDAIVPPTPTPPSEITTIETPTPTPEPVMISPESTPEITTESPVPTE